jgi:transposase
MARPLSNDLRERVVAAIVGGESCRSVASRFGVAVSSVVKWSQRYRATGSVAPGKVGGHRKRVLEPHRAFVLERIGQTPRLTLHGLKEELAARGVNVSHNAVWLFLRREGLRFKKTLFALEQARADIARRRRRWRSWQAHLDPRRLVFIDETWIKTSMAPLRGWGPKGDRVRGLVPRGHWRTLTFLGALRCDQLAAPCVFDGPINGECFRAYVEQQLVPLLKPGDIVIMEISAATSRLHSAPSSGPPAQGSGTCRPTHPTSIRSSRLSPRSNTGCVPLKSEPSKMPGDTSAAWSKPSTPPNATTTSLTPDTLPSKNETL